MRGYTPELAVDLQLPSQVQVSPDGTQVAFCLAPIGHRDTKPTSTLLLAVPGAAPRALTAGDYQVTSPRWSPDGQTLAFLADRGTRGDMQLHTLALAGGEPRALTQTRGADSPAWSPCGNFIFLLARRTALRNEPEPKREFIVGSERANPRGLARVSVLGGAPQPIGPADGHVQAYSVSPDGTQVAAIMADSDQLDTGWTTSRVVLFATDGSGDVRVVTPITGFPGTPTWSPDGRTVAIIASLPEDADDARIRLIDVATGEFTSFDAREETPTWISFTEDGEGLLVHSVERQWSRLSRTDLRGAEWEAVELGDEVAGRWIESGLNIHAAGGSLTFTAARETRPSDVYLQVAGAQAAALTNLHPQLDDVRLAPMEALRWTATDGTEVDGWLILPPDAAEGTRLPLVAAIHGGPSWQWGNWFHGTWHDWGQVLAAQGYAVFMPNPRGSSGRGGGFQGANRYDFGGGDFDDIMTGIDALIERGVADADRLGICGWSFGGFMTAWAVTQTDRFKAGVAGAAPTNWISKIGTTDIRPANEWNIGVVNTEPEVVWKVSPMRYAGQAKTPTLVVHGNSDVRVPVTQGWEFYNALHANGVDAEMVAYPRQGHAFHERAAQLDLLKRLIGWFEKYLV